MSQVPPTSSSASGCSSAAHRVLAIPEILEVIFSFGTRASNVSYALVCRGWRELALDNVWREVDDIYYLLQLLTPLKWTYTSSNDHHGKIVSFFVFCSHWMQPSKTQVSFQVFCRIPTPEDWSRFMPYARRVHSLKYGIKRNEKASDLEESVFREVFLTRSTLEVLPNLRSLWWDSIQCVRYAELFMHDKVTEFGFKLHSEEFPLLRTYIVGRMPSLRSLSWTSCIRDSHLKVEGELLQLLSSLQELREVTPPKNFLSSKFLKALSSLPELETIQYEDLDEMPYSMISPLQCTLQEGAFPKLSNLRLNSNLDDIRVCLTGGALLPRLRNLVVEGDRWDPLLPLTVQPFLTAVTGCYPTLEMVSMDIMVGIEKQDALSREHLNPILLLKQLTHLELRHNHPLRISEVDLAEFGDALPALEKLVLNPEPLQPTRPEITLHSLLVVAQHFPNLSYLGIYLDAQGTTIPMPHSPAKTGIFPSLLTLHMGISPIDSEVAAMFLSDMLLENERVKMKSGISRDQANFVSDSDYYSATVSERCSRWDLVANSLPLLLKVRKEEKARKRVI
jgi:hypothetical protein